MAEITQVQTTGPTTAEGFLADRQAFWAWFTKGTLYATCFVAVLLVLLCIFLV